MVRSIEPINVFRDGGKEKNYKILLPCTLHNVTSNTSSVTCNRIGMSEADRTRKWREKRKAEGKKSFTILLSEEAQRIIKAEREATGENYSAIIERALKSTKGTGYQRGLKFRPISTLKSPPVTEAVTSDNHIPKSSPILIDDLQNYELLDTRTMPGQGLGKKENVLSRLLGSKFPGKKGWFK